MRVEFFRPCWCPSPFPLPSISWCFSIHFTSPAIEFHSSIFHGGGICTPPLTLPIYSGLGDWHRATADPEGFGGHVPGLPPESTPMNQIDAPEVKHKVNL